MYNVIVKIKKGASRKELKMTKQEATEIKKAIKGFTVYFQSKTEKNS